MRQYYPLDADQRRAGRAGRSEPPDYKVYRSRPGLLSRLRSPDLSKLARAGERQGRQGRQGRPAAAGRRRTEPARAAAVAPGAASGWGSRRSPGSCSASSPSRSPPRSRSGSCPTWATPLHGNPFLAVSPQTILVLGTDIRSGQFAGPDEAASKNCLEAAGSGKAPPTHCTPLPLRHDHADPGGRRRVPQALDPARHAGRRSRASGQNKINSAYAFGGAKLTIRTVEKFLGINVDQVAIIDFDGFRKFIDTIGGVEVDLPTKVCSNVSGGAFNLKLDKGEHTLERRPGDHPRADPREHLRLRPVHRHRHRASRSSSS